VPFQIFKKTVVALDELALLYHYNFYYLII